jgi:hypothetical protein
MTKPYGNGQKINAVIKAAFSNVGLHPYFAHSFWKTLALYPNRSGPARWATSIVLNASS